MDNSFSASEGISCHSLLGGLRPKGFGVVYPTAFPVIIDKYVRYAVSTKFSIYLYSVSFR